MLRKLVFVLMCLLIFYSKSFCKFLYVNIDLAEIRTEPNNESPIIYKAMRGAKLQILHYEKGWCEIKFLKEAYIAGINEKDKDITGWIKREFLVEQEFPTEKTKVKKLSKAKKIKCPDCGGSGYIEGHFEEVSIPTGSEMIWVPKIVAFDGLVGDMGHYEQRTTYKTKNVWVPEESCDFCSGTGKVTLYKALGEKGYIASIAEIRFLNLPARTRIKIPVAFEEENQNWDGTVDFDFGDFPQDVEINFKQIGLIFSGTPLGGSKDTYGLGLFYVFSNNKLNIQTEFPVKIRTSNYPEIIEEVLKKMDLHYLRFNTIGLSLNWDMINVIKSKEEDRQIYFMSLGVEAELIYTKFETAGKVSIDELNWEQDFKYKSEFFDIPVSAYIKFVIWPFETTLGYTFLSSPNSGIGHGPFIRMGIGF